MKSKFKFKTNTWVKHKPTGLKFEITFIRQYSNWGEPLYSGANGQVSASYFPESELKQIKRQEHYS